MTELFEVISEDEFIAETTVEVGVFDNTVDTGRPTIPTSTTDMIYCDFCKGWYFPEYHYGDVSND